MISGTKMKFPFIHLETLWRSFIPYTLKLWNLLLVQDCTISCLDEFTSSALEMFNTDSKILYYNGQRSTNVHHARIQIGCCGLNYDLYTNLHIINSPFLLMWCSARDCLSLRHGVYSLLRAAFMADRRSYFDMSI